MAGPFTTLPWNRRPPPAPAVLGGPFPAPLSTVVERLLYAWGIDSDESSDDSDDFCGWRAGSRRLSVPDKRAVPSSATEPASAGPELPDTETGPNHAVDGSSSSSWYQCKPQ